MNKHFYHQPPTPLEPGEGHEHAEETHQLATWTRTGPREWQVARMDAAEDVLFSSESPGAWSLKL